MIDRLVLGTVQLGLAYGINNKAGKPDFNGVCDIIKTAFDQSINRFDTAQAYGDSEEILGKVFDKLKINKKVKVYSKLDPRLDLCDKFAVERSIDDSLNRLKIDQLEGLLIHHEDGLNHWDKGSGGILRGLVAKGVVRLVGASFYTPQKAFDALGIDGIDIIQVPANILDRRFKNIGGFTKAEERNKDVFVRSIFLQGLLLMDQDRVPFSMSDALPYLERFARIAGDIKLSRKELVFGYAHYAWPRAFIVFGAETSKQVRENALLAKCRIDGKTYKRIERELAGAEEKLLNPALWPK